MTATKNTASRTRKNLVKRIVSLLMAFTMLFGAVSMCALQASAAESSRQKIVVRSGYSYRTAYARNNIRVASVKGNYWSRRTVTLGVQNNSYDWNVMKEIKRMARFDIIVKDASGRTVASYWNKSYNFSFKLPMWSTQTYTIYVSSRFVNYDSYSLYRMEALDYGYYFLKY
jgi:hypothetical protein